MDPLIKSQPSLLAPFVVTFAGCAAFKSIMDEIEFPAPQPRVEAPSAAEVARARAAAHELGHSESGV